MVMSEGAAYVSDKGEAGWLLSDIAAYYVKDTPVSNLCKKSASFNSLHFWDLDVDLEERTAVLTCRKDSGQPAIVTQKYLYTDFPLKNIKFFAGCDGGPMKTFLPSEY